MSAIVREKNKPLFMIFPEQNMYMLFYLETASIYTSHAGFNKLAFFSISVIVYILTSQNAIWNCWVFSLSTYILTATNKYYTISWSCFLTHVTFLHSFDLFTACILRKLSLYRKIIWKISKISCNSVALHRHNPLWVEKCVLLEIGGIQEHRPSPSSSYLHRFFQSYSRAILTSL